VACAVIGLRDGSRREPIGHSFGTRPKERMNEQATRKVKNARIQNVTVHLR